MKLFAGFILTMAFVCSAAAQSSSALVGKWFEGSASILAEQNQITGAITSRYSSTIGYTVCVDTVFKPGMAYDPASNVETCDSL